MKKLTLFCSAIANVHLTKDIVMIPYIMDKYYEYKSEVITCKIDDELIDDKIYLDNLPITLVNDNNELIKKLSETDVLMLFGIYNWNLEIIQLYNNLKPNGKIYLKLDANTIWMFNLNKSIDENVLQILRKCTLITVESRRLQHLLNASWGLNIQYLTNGYYDFTEDTTAKYDEKKNIIMFAGRVGTQQKSNETLLEAFKNIQDKIETWSIELIGPVEESFLQYFNKYIDENPYLKDRVVLIGNLNKTELKDKYKQSKVFCITSILEGCANVFSEAISNGCYLISSDVDSVIDIIDYGRYGSIFPIGNVAKLEEIILDICNNEDLLRTHCYKSQEYAKNSLSWIKICKDLDNML